MNSSLGKNAKSTTKYHYYGPNNNIEQKTITTDYLIKGSQKVFFCYKCMAREEIKDKIDKVNLLWILVILLYILGAIYFIISLNLIGEDNKPSSVVVETTAGFAAVAFLAGTGIVFKTIKSHNKYSNQISAMEDENNNSFDPKIYQWDEDKGDNQAIEKMEPILQPKGYDGFFTRSRYQLINPKPPVTREENKSEQPNKDLVTLALKKIHWDAVISMLEAEKQRQVKDWIQWGDHVKGIIQAETNKAASDDLVSINLSKDNWKTLNSIIMISCSKRGKEWKIWGDNITQLIQQAVEKPKNETQLKQAISEKMQEKQVEDNKINPVYEQRLKIEFGLSPQNDGWLFEGGTIIDDMVSRLSEPDLCLGILNNLQVRTHFSQVCIMTGHKGIFLVCNTTPKPVCIASGLSASGLADLIATMLKTNGNQVVTYRGTWLITLL